MSNGRSIPPVPFRNPRFYAISLFLSMLTAVGCLSGRTIHTLEFAWIEEGRNSSMFICLIILVLLLAQAPSVSSISYLVPVISAFCPYDVLSGVTTHEGQTALPKVLFAHTFLSGLLVAVLARCQGGANFFNLDYAGTGIHIRTCWILTILASRRPSCSTESCTCMDLVLLYYLC